MHKSLIVGAAVLASVTVLTAVLLVTRTPDGVDSASADRTSPLRTAPAHASEAAEETRATAPSLAIPDTTPEEEAARATAYIEPPAPPANPRAPLARGAVRYCGHIEQPDGSTAAEARIVLFANVSGEPGRVPLVQTRSDASGAFCIDAEEPSELILLAFADGFEPLTREIHRATQSENDLGPLRLSNGASISGHASSEGRPLPRAEIAAVLDSPLETFAIDNGFLKWIHRHFVWSFAISDSKEDGTYSISGLEPEAYKVRISSLRGRQAVLGFQSSANRDARAPAENVDFALDAATQRVTFHYNGGPLRGVEAQLEAGGAHLTASSDADGTCTFKVTPRLEFTLIGSLTGYKVVRMPLTAAGPGEERSQVVDLEIFHPPATLIFDLVPPGGARVQRARFVFYGSDASDGKASFVKEVDLKSPERSRAPRNVGPRDEFEAAGIPPGVYRIVVQAGEVLGYASTPLGNAPYCEYCDVDVAVSVPATGEVRQTVNLVPRSTLQIAARDRTGRSLAAQAKLFDTRGAPIETSLAVRRNNIWQSLTALDENDYTTVRSTLCNGPADIEVSCKGYRSKRVKVSFEGQRSLPIEVTLEPE